MNADETPLSSSMLVQMLGTEGFGRGLISADDSGRLQTPWFTLDSDRRYSLAPSQKLFLGDVADAFRRHLDPTCRDLVRVSEWDRERRQVNYRFHTRYKGLLEPDPSTTMPKNGWAGVTGVPGVGPFGGGGSGISVGSGMGPFGICGPVISVGSGMGGSGGSQAFVPSLSGITKAGMQHSPTISHRTERTPTALRAIGADPLAIARAIYDSISGR